MWIRNGSRREVREEKWAGVLMEHMAVFKGTERQVGGRRLRVEMDSVGGDLDAFTSKEQICRESLIYDHLSTRRRTHHCGSSAMVTEMRLGR